MFRSLAMKYLIHCLLVGTLSLITIATQAQENRPSYCDALPTTYEKGGSRSSRSSLPKFGTTPTKEYKVQVAILRNTDPSDYPFHEKLVARYRPCEQVWVVESRESYSSLSTALKLRNELRSMGYSGAYLVELVGYQ